MQMFQVFPFTLYLNKIIPSERTELEEKQWDVTFGEIRFEICIFTPIQRLMSSIFTRFDKFVSLEKC